MNKLKTGLESIWHPFSPAQGDAPLLVESAEGIYLNIEDGRRIIDGISSWWVNLHGHSHPAIAEAIHQQALTLEHVIFAGFTHRPAIELASRLLTILPSNQTKVFYSDNGSTAVEVAIKMAIQYWYNKGTPKSKLVAIDGAYHGDTFGAMSVGGRSLFTNPFQHHLFEVDFLPWPNGRNDDEVVAKFQTQLKSENIAAFIYEPLVQGAAGMRMYSPQLLGRLLDLAKRFAVPCIADEVFTGFGRTGKLFASEYMSQQPDIIALSKGLTGGTMALGVTTCSTMIYDAFQSSDPSKVFYHGHSFTANPIACASALASFDLLMHPHGVDARQRIAQQQESFAAAVKHYPVVKSVRCLGTIMSMELDAGETGYTNSLRHEIYTHFLSRDILLRPLGNVLYFLPSYAFRENDISLVHREIEVFLKKLEGRRDGH